MPRIFSGEPCSGRRPGIHVKNPPGASSAVAAGRKMHVKNPLGASSAVAASRTLPKKIGTQPSDAGAKSDSSDMIRRTGNGTNDNDTTSISGE